MATASQINANRKNAHHSTGPRTAEGKTRSAANATRHNLTGAFTVLSSESQEEFDALLQGIRLEVDPQGSHENFLVDQLAQSRWRILRAERLESRLFEQAFETSDLSDPDAAILASMRSTGADLLNLLLRYRTSAERSYHKAKREIIASRDRIALIDSLERKQRDAAVANQCLELERQTDAFLHGLRTFPNEPDFTLTADPLSTYDPSCPTAEELLAHGISPSLVSGCR